MLNKVKNIFLLTTLILLITSCGVANNNNTSSQSNIDVVISTPIPVDAIGESIPITIFYGNAQGSGIIDLSILGAQTQGLSLSNSRIAYSAGDGSSTIYLMASEIAVPSSNFSPIEIIGTVNEDIVSNSLDIKIVKPGAVVFTQSNITTLSNQSATATLVIVDNDFSQIESVNVGLSANSSNISFANGSEICVFTINNKSCNITINNNGISGDYQVYATPNNQAPTSLSFTVVTDGNIGFTSNSVTMLTNSQYTVSLALNGSFSQGNIPVVIKSSSDNLSLSTTQCNLSSTSSTCNILINSDAVAGTYQITAISPDFNISPLTVEVSNPGTVSFNVNTLNMLTRSSSTVELSLFGNDINIESVIVNLSLTESATSGVTITPNKCLFTNASRSCVIQINSSNTTGNFQIQANATGYSIKSVALNVRTPGTINFAFNDITMTTNNSGQVDLILNGPSSNLPAVNVMLSSNNANLVVSPTVCKLSPSVTLCSVSFTSNAGVGTYQISAVADGYQISPVVVNVVNPGTIAFNISKLNMLTNASNTIQLELAGNAGDIGSIEVMLTTSSESGITVMPSACTLSAISKNCVVAVNSRSNVGSYQIIAQATGYNIKPLVVNVNTTGTISFSTNTVNLLPNSKAQVDLVLNGASSGLPSFTVNLLSNNSNLIATPAVCTLSKSQTTCTISLTSNQIVGNYQVTATAGGYNINPLTVNVLSANTIQFLPSSIQQLPSDTQAFVLELFATETTPQPIPVNLSTSSPNLILGATPCVLSSNSPTCTVYATNNGVTGSYQLQAQAVGYSTVPASVQVISPASINFNQSQIDIVAGSSYTVTLQATPSSALLTPTTVNFNTTSANVTTNPTSCILTNSQPSCAVSIVSNNTPGNYQVIASSIGYNISPLNVLTYDQGSIAFNPSQIIEPLGQNIQTTLSIIGATTNTPAVPVVLASSNTAFQITNPTSLNCNLTYANPNCTITGVSSTVGAYHILATAADYTIIPFSIQAIESQGAIAFANTSLSVYTGESIQTTINLYNPEPILAPVNVNITSNPGGLVVSPSQCTLSPANSSCTLTITNNSVPGNYTLTATASGYTIIPANVAVNNPELTIYYLADIYPGISYPLSFQAPTGSSVITVVPSGSGTIASNTCSLNASNQYYCYIMFTVEKSGDNLTMNISNNGVLIDTITVSGYSLDNNPIIIVNGSGGLLSFNVHGGDNITSGNTILLSDGQGCYVPAGWGFTSPGNYLFIETNDGYNSYNAINYRTDPGYAAFASANTNSDGYSNTWGRFYQISYNYNNWQQATYNTAQGTAFNVPNDSYYPYYIAVGQINPQVLSPATNASPESYGNLYYNGLLPNCGITIAN